MAITRINPSDLSSASLVQVDSDAENPWTALEEIETWAARNGFVRTSEFQPRPVLINGKRQFRAICYRITDEERAAMDADQLQMTERSERLRGVVPHAIGGT